MKNHESNKMVHFRRIKIFNSLKTSRQRGKKKHLSDIPLSVNIITVGQEELTNSVTIYFFSYSVNVLRAILF